MERVCGSARRMACALAVAAELAAAWPAAARAEPEIRKAGDGKAAYYLMMFALTRDNTVFPGADQGVTSAHGASFTLRDGGQFEVMIKKTAFPVAAPACDARIIVRMPWTDADAPGGKAAVAEKEALFAALDRLRRGEIAALPVAIDLSPYARVNGPLPSGLALTACNVFFRDVGGRYESEIEDTRPR